jgi:hypothetical protein
MHLSFFLLGICSHLRWADKFIDKQIFLELICYLIGKKKIAKTHCPLLRHLIRKKQNGFGSSLSLLKHQIPFLGREGVLFVCFHLENQMIFKTMHIYILYAYFDNHMRSLNVCHSEMHFCPSEVLS